MNFAKQVDCEELVAFLVEKSQKLTDDKDFVVAMDRLNQFALHMKQRERMAQVIDRARSNFFVSFSVPSLNSVYQDLATVLADSNGVISSQHMHWFFDAEGSRECAIHYS
jgi:GTP-dependent phosphoenolpyruvate carboxykinase